MTSAAPKPRAGEQAKERIAELEEVKRAYARDIHLLWAECDALRSRNAELVEALRRAVGWVGATGNGKPVVDPRQLEDYNFARAVLAKAPT